MPIPNITFNNLQNQLGVQGGGTDYISGIIFYSNTSTTSKNGRYTITSVQDAINKLGLSYAKNINAILTISTSPTSLDDTSLSLYAIVNGNKKSIIANDLYTYLTGDFGSIPTLTTNLVSAINNYTSLSGISATSTVSGTINLIGFPFTKLSFITLENGTAPTAVVNSTVTSPITDSTDIWLYHISQYFQINNTGLLYIGVYSNPSSFTGAEIIDLQNYANGAIVQLAIYRDQTSYGTGGINLVSELTAIQNVLSNGTSSLDYIHKPISAVIYTLNFQGVSDISTLIDGTLQNDYKISVDISQSASGLGSALFSFYNKTISNIGALLGAVSSSSVSEDIANPISKYDLTQGGNENLVLGFANGQSYLSISGIDSLLNSLNDKRYITLRQFTGLGGSYCTQDNTFAVLQGNDYAYIHQNRVIDKAKKIVYIALLPYLNGRIYLNTDGTISNISIQSLQAICSQALDTMVVSGDLSGKSVTINPNQNIKSTGVLQITVILNEVAIAMEYLINIGF